MLSPSSTVTLAPGVGALGPPLLVAAGGAGAGVGVAGGDAAVLGDAGAMAILILPDGRVFVTDGR